MQTFSVINSTHKPHWLLPKHYIFHQPLHTYSIYIQIYYILYKTLQHKKLSKEQASALIDRNIVIQSLKHSDQFSYTLTASSPKTVILICNSLVHSQTISALKFIAGKSVGLLSYSCHYSQIERTN